MEGINLSLVVNLFIFHRDLVVKKHLKRVIIPKQCLKRLINPLSFSRFAEMFVTFKEKKKDNKSLIRCG